MITSLKTELILTVKFLCPVQAMDSLVWWGTINDVFSVKSVYHMEKELQAIRRSWSSREGVGDYVWKMIWNLKILNAIKMFMCKACTDLLPTKVNLLWRGVVSDSLCSICLREDEMVKHILWSCPSAQDVPRNIQKGIAGGPTFFAIFEELMGRCDLQDLELVLVMARIIWFRRNGVVHGGEFTHPQQVFREASASIEEFQRVEGLSMTVPSPTPAGSQALWRPPPSSLFKVNWDI